MKQVVLWLSSNMIGNSDDENNFVHKLLLTNRHVTKPCKAFANNSSANIKLSRANIKLSRTKVVRSGGFLDRLLTPLLKAGLP